MSSLHAVPPVTTPPSGAGVGSARATDHRVKAIRLLEGPLPIDEIARDPDQPRKHFDSTKLQELAESIRSQGVLQPVIVRQIPTTDPDRPGLTFPWRLISGERRWRAAMIVGLTAIPAVEAVNATEGSAAAIALVENAQRQDLSPFEVARHLRKLRDEYGYTLEELGEMIGGATKGRVSKMLSILNLPEPLHAPIEAGTLTLRHTETLMQLKTADAVEWGLRAALEEWSSRELESRTQHLRSPGTKRKRAPASGQASSDPDITHLVNRLTEYLSSRVKLEPAKKGKGGKLVISYYDNDTLSGLLQRIGLPTED